MANSRTVLSITFLGAFAAFVLPALWRSVVLLGVVRSWQPDSKFAGLLKTCKPLHPHKLMACEKFTIVDDELFAACPDDWETRRKWFPPMGQFNKDIGPPGKARGKLYKMNIDSHDIIELQLDGFPIEIDFVVHGMDVVKVNNEQYSIYAINHRREGGSVIEKFTYRKDSAIANHVATFNGSTAGLYNPNDIYAVPISEKTPDTESVFFVTHDHYFRESHLGRQLEDILRLPITSVFYHTTSKGFHPVLNNIAGANGVAGTRSFNMDASVAKNKIFVASVSAGKILVYDYPANPAAVFEKSSLKHIKTITLDFVVDNLAIDDSSKWLYAAGHAQPVPNLLSNWNEPDKIVSPSIAYRIGLVEFSGGFFGTRGEVGEIKVERLVVDKEGLIGNASTISAGDDTRGKFWLSGLTTKGITECDLPKPATKYSDNIDNISEDVDD